MSEIPVSVLILTLNEETNIGRCLTALGWSDDVVVLDSFSTDRTVELAQNAGARIHQRAFDNFAGQRNHALNHVEFKHDWVLHLDADEVVTEALMRELERVVRQPEFDAYRIAGKLIFQGRWLRRSGMYPVYQVRLGHKEKLRFRQSGHGQQETLATERIGTLSEPYLHYGFSKGIGDWIERHNRYSSAEAKENVRDQQPLVAAFRQLFAADRTRRRRGMKALSRRLPFRPFLRFLYMYLLKMGFMDGHPGWTYCRMMAAYEYWIVLKERELRRARK